MSKVFVSYARQDKRDVARLVSALRKIGFEPWWDDDISPGASWEQTIEEALAEADSVIVCWSAASTASENVRSEARVARTRGRLVQLFLEPCDPPLFFGERQGIDLTDWNGAVGDARIKRLKEALKSVIAGQPVSPEPAPTRRRARLPKRTLAVGIAAIALVALGGWWWESASSAKPPSRIAVQPIRGLGGASAVASFADGLTDQITTSLNDGHIPTISRSDSESVKGGNVNERLTSLGVGYTLNGTVESSGKTLHARLHFDDNVRHASLWSYETSGPADDPMALNYAIAHSIAGVVSCAYRALAPGGLTDTDLLSRYLRVCDLFVNHQDATDTKSTFELLSDLRLITARAPNFAPAHSDFAKFSAYLAPLMPSDQAASARAESAREATRALELDPHSSDAWLAREMVLRPTDWTRREALLRKAVAVNPSWPHSNGFLALFLAESGRVREAAVYAQRAAAADLQLDWRPIAARISCDAGSSEAAIADLRQRLAVSPGDPEIQWALRWCMFDTGQYREAKALEPATPKGDFELVRQTIESALISGEPVDRAKALQLAANIAAADSSTVPFVIQWTAALGDVDSAFRFSGELLPGYPTTDRTFFLFTPQTASMRADPRFFALAKRYGLAQYWQSTGRWPDFCSGPRLSGCKSAVATQLAQR